MTEIPLVWLVTALTSIGAVALARATRLPLAARVFLVAGLLALGVLGFLLGVRFGLGLDWVRFVQPIVGILVAPALYLGLAALTVDGAYAWRSVALRHLLPIVVLSIAMVATQLWLADFVIPLITLVYLVLLSRLAMRPLETFIHVTPRDQPVVKAVILGVIALFLFFLLADVAIYLLLLAGGSDPVSNVVAVAALVLTVFVFLAALLGMPTILSLRDRSEPNATQVVEATDEDRELLDAFGALLEDARLYTDSGLTLARAARRLGVPARRLSEAVNRVAGTNVSRHINSYRIAHAKRLLAETDLPVTEVMLEAGFLSKSTFNTEFRRITGQTPSAFRRPG